MAGKSGRTINNVPESPLKRIILSWEGILVLLLIAVNIFCKFYSEFYSASSLLNQMPIHLAEVFLMLPMAFILVLGEIDISVGSIVCLSATLACIVGNQGQPFIVVVLVALAVGLACGLINGVILTRFPELPPMIVTLATQIIFRGLAEGILGEGGSIGLDNDSAAKAGFKLIAGKTPGIGGELVKKGKKEVIQGAISFPYILFLVLILGIIFAVILGRSTFGRRVYAIGTNRTTAHYSGIHVQKIRLIIYAVMGLLSGVSALFIVSSSFSAVTDTGTGFEMDAIAMAVFGGISSTGGKGNLAGGLISAFIIMCLRIGLGQRNVHPQVILLIIGALLIAAVALPSVVSQIRRSVKKA